VGNVNDIAALLGQHPLGGIFLVVFIWVVAPDIVLRLFVLVYPKSSDRRKELIAELRVVRLWDRLPWVAGQLTMIVTEGWGDRLRARRARNAQRPKRIWGPTPNRRRIDTRTATKQLTVQDLVWRENKLNEDRISDIYRQAVSGVRVDGDSVRRGLIANLHSPLNDPSADSTRP
jgi:Ribonuclease G/E